jgi:hypothetical protein
MPLSPEKRAFLVDKLGEERVAQIEAYLANKAQELEEAGVDFKSFCEDGLCLGTADIKGIADSDPIAPYIRDLRSRRRPFTVAQKAALKALEVDSDPIAPYIADLIQGKIERG